MSRVLIYFGSHDNNCINAAYERLEMGDDVRIVRCDRSIGICRHNMFGAQWECRYCEHVNNKLWKDDLLKLGATIISLSSIITEEDRNVADSASFNYNSVDELKAVRYNDVEIGFGAFSTFCTISRNVMPEINAEFKNYIDFIMRKEICAINAIERQIRDFNPDLIIFHNGRFAEFKPILGLTLKFKIPFICTEEVYYKGRMYKDNYMNDIVHSVKLRCEKIKDNWNKGLETEEEKTNIGKSFYEKRVKGIVSGDKVYTGMQVCGRLPEGFDANKENIAIFNSSEDEFCAVSSDWDKGMLFKNQYTALKEVFEHYKEDYTKHFYLRIHPNLNNVPYPSHYLLYGLRYRNVSILPPESPVDSYVLMSNANKVITFNSTMSIECAYWGKPVIALNWYVWNELNVVHSPKTVDDLWRLIDDKNLQCLKNENCIKYGYSILHPNRELEDKIKYTNVDFKILGRRVHEEYAIYTFLGSYRLHSLIKNICNVYHIRKVFWWAYKFKEIPGRIRFKEIQNVYNKYKQ